MEYSKVEKRPVLLRVEFRDDEIDWKIYFKLNTMPNRTY